MEPSGVFGPAISELRSQGSNLFGPVAFQDYCQAHGIAARRTASWISIDSIDRLDKSLRTHGCMVLRLGQRSGSRTDFALVRVPEAGPECFFLLDEDVFASAQVQSFVPAGSIRDLLPFHALNQLSERSATLLGVGAGLLQEALRLDEPPSAPVSDSGVYTFDFVPHHGLRPLRHNRGQVEIDGLFLGRRGGADCLFVIEAKLGQRMGSVSKHKLAYPAYGIAEKVPRDIPIVPVYLRIVRQQGALTYYVAECLPLGRTQPLTDLTPKEMTALRLVVPSLSFAGGG